MAGREVLFGSAAALMALTTALVPAPVLAQTTAAAAARDVGPADPLRPVLLNALRPAIVADLGQSVKFVVATLRTQGDWAYVVARPQRPDGREIDFRATRYREQIEQGVFDGPTLYALMQRRAQRWIVVDFVIGPTDVHHAGWPEEFGAPAGMLGLPGQ